MVARRMATSTIEEHDLRHWLGFVLVVLVTGGLATVFPVLLHVL